MKPVLKAGRSSLPMRTWGAILLAGGVSVALALVAVDSRGFLDPLEAPAAELKGALSARTEVLLGVSSVGRHAVAVGLRGVVVYSDDTASTWRQARVPAQVDLASVQVLDDRLAWASGHDSVILHSDDGGATWHKQFDRNQAKTVLVAAYQQRINAGQGQGELQRYLDQVKLNTDGDVSLPFLGVWFDDALHGWAVGSFGMLVATTDGGTTWTPWLDRIDNEQFLNLNSIRGIAGEVYIAGEHGMVWRLDRPHQRFVALPTGYAGSFFDIIGSSRSLLAFGLRGAAYRSDDAGRSWRVGKTGTERSLTAGAVLEDGRRTLLFNEAGQVLQSTDDGLTFKLLDLPRRAPVYGAALAAGGLLTTVGFAGLDTQPVKTFTP